jgi:hypothetical protein
MVAAVLSLKNLFKFKRRINELVDFFTDAAQFEHHIANRQNVVLGWDMRMGVFHHSTVSFFLRGICRTSESTRVISTASFTIDSFQIASWNLPNQ